MPSASAAEAAVVVDIDIIPVARLGQAMAFFAGQVEIEPAPSRVHQWFEEYGRYDEDFADVRGQEGAKRQHLNEAINYRMLDRQLWK